jgi:hypothetical protein
MQILKDGEDEEEVPLLMSVRRCEECEGSKQQLSCGTQYHNQRLDNVNQSLTHWHAHR